MQRLLHFFRLVVLGCILLFVSSTIVNAQESIDIRTLSTVYFSPTQEDEHSEFLNELQMSLLSTWEKLTIPLLSRLQQNHIFWESRHPE